MSTPQQPGWYWLGNKPEHIEAVCTSRTGGPAVTESEWLALLKEKPREADAVVARECFGWKECDVQIGAALVRADGSIVPNTTPGWQSRSGRKYATCNAEVPPRYASGDSWELFGQMWDALPRQRYQPGPLCWSLSEARILRTVDDSQLADGEPKHGDILYHVRSLLGPSSEHLERNAAVALALLKAKGVIQEDGQ